MEKYNVTGMSCSACSASVEKAVKGVAGVENCTVNLLTNSMMVEGSASAGAIIAAVEQAGYGASLADNKAGKTTSQRQMGGADELDNKGTLRKMKIRLLVSVLLLLPLMYLSMGHMMWGWPLPERLAKKNFRCALFIRKILAECEA